MKLLLSLLLLTGCAFGQMPAKPSKPDSLFAGDPGKAFPPDQMPIVRTDVSFHRYSVNLMRALTDNMTVKLPDSSTHYTMQQLYHQSFRPDTRGHQFLKPMPRIVPRKFRH